MSKKIFFAIKKYPYILWVYIIKKIKMISYLSGKVINLTSNSVDVLTSGGVWYEVNINEVISANLMNKEDIELFIHHHITEGNQSLFWFIEADDKAIFKELIKISWVGWKVALVILSLWKSALAEAILTEDKKTIESVKWIWKKMAEKIILELKDKDFIKLNYSASTEIKEEVSNITIDSDLKANILETLVNMGYNSKSVLKELERIPKDMKEAWEIIPFLIKNL